MRRLKTIAGTSRPIIGAHPSQGRLQNCGTLTFPTPVELIYKGNIAYHVPGPSPDGRGSAHDPAQRQRDRIRKSGRPRPLTSDHNLAIRRAGAAAGPDEAIYFFPLDTIHTDGDGVNPWTADHWTDDIGALAANKTTENGVVTLAAMGGDVLQLTGNCAAPAAAGAQIKCRYNNDGTLSATPLWPWPYAAEIAAFLAESPYSNLGFNHNGLKDVNTFMQQLTGATFVAGTPHLAFGVPGSPATQPTGTTVGIAIPAFTLCAFDAGNNVSGGFANTITLALASGAGALSGTLAVAPVNGCATFSNVIPDTVGAKTLTATATGITSGTSASFTVVAAPVVPPPPPTPSTVLYWVQ